MIQICITIVEYSAGVVRPICCIHGYTNWTALNGRGKSWTANTVLIILNFKRSTLFQTRLISALISVLVLCGDAIIIDIIKCLKVLSTVTTVISVIGTAVNKLLFRQKDRITFKKWVRLKCAYCTESPTGSTLTLIFHRWDSSSCCPINCIYLR